MSEARDETIAVLQTIPGGQRLLDWLDLNYGGFPPEFGDSEIVSLSVAQGGESGLTLKVDRYWRDRTPPLDEKGIVRFVFSDLVGIHLEGILVRDGVAGPNVINALYFRRASETPVHPAPVGLGFGRPYHEIEIEPIAGAHGIIRATITRIEIEVRPIIPAA